jgi:drug/metabolite transporter (DMT)-like permease
MSSRAGPSSSIDDNQNIPAGIGLMLFGFVLFSANDALAKWMAGIYAPGQMLLVRSVASALVISPFIVRGGLRSLFAVEHPWLHVLRVVFATAEVLLFYWAVSGLALADAITYYLAGPIYVTVLAAFFLNERIGWRRWSAVAVGFVGVLIALKPSSGVFNYHALIAFAGSILYALFLVVTRRLREAPDLTLAAWQMVGTLIAGVAVAPFDWRPFAHAQDIPMLALLGVMALVAIVAVNRSLRLAPASVVVPYQYTMIVWAALFGYFVFGEVPGWHVLAGATIIVAAGLYIFFREQIVAKPAVPQVSPGPQ